MRPQLNISAERITQSVSNANKLRQLGGGTLCVALLFPFWPSSPTFFELFIICALLGLCYLQRRRVFYIGLLFGLIFFTYHTTRWQHNANVIKHTTTWQIVGVIEEVGYSSRGTKLRVSVNAPTVLSQQTFQLIDSNANVEYQHGQHWLFSIAITPVFEHWHATKPYQRRLFGQNIHATGWVQSSLLQHHSPSIRGQLFTELRRLGVNTDSWLPALLLGLKPRDNQLSTILKNAGIIHLFVISGLHFAVVAAAMYWLCIKVTGVCHMGLGYRQRRGLICIVLMLIGFMYVDLVGAQGPAQRAFVAMCVGLFLRLMYVRVRWCDLLVWVFFYLVVSNPFCVMLASVYLTFGALLCIGLCTHWLSLAQHSWWQKIQAFLAFQIVLTVLFTPIQYYVLGYIHPLSWLWNLLFIPIVTLFYVPTGLILMVIMYCNMSAHTVIDPFVQGWVSVLDVSLEWLIRGLEKVLTEPLYGTISSHSLVCSWLLVIAGASLPMNWWRRCSAVVMGLGLLILGITL